MVNLPSSRAATAPMAVMMPVNTMMFSIPPEDQHFIRPDRPFPNASPLRTLVQALEPGGYKGQKSRVAFNPVRPLEDNALVDESGIEKRRRERRATLGEYAGDTLICQPAQRLPKVQSRPAGRTLHPM